MTCVKRKDRKRCVYRHWQTKHVYSHIYIYNILDKYLHVYIYIFIYTIYPRSPVDQPKCLVFTMIPWVSPKIFSTYQRGRSLDALQFGTCQPQSVDGLTKQEIPMVPKICFFPPNTWPCLLATANYLQGTINRLVFLLTTVI